jgi:beta-1,4-mannosyl-glycoprotein beta-1,4-N-acetylglucosaminyltransferase
MKKYLFAALLFFSCTVKVNASCAKHAKIYDCFIFFNELDLLELKLNELTNHVDKFVLVESTVTFQGSFKPLVFLENRNRFKKFLDKIIYVVVADTPSNCGSWQREAYQRNQIMRGLTHCKDNDIIILEDLDEIIRPSVLPEIVGLLNHPDAVISCTQDMYRFYMDLYCRKWQGSIVARYSYMKSRSLDSIRNQRDQLPRVANAGWHFTYIGGVEKTILKLKSFSHTEYSTTEETDPVNVAALLKHQSKTTFGKILDEEDSARHVVPVTAEAFPQYLVENLSAFIEKGYFSPK